MKFADGRAFGLELQRAFEQYKRKPTRDSVRWLHQCLEGLRFVPDAESDLCVLNWHEGQAITLMRLEGTEQNQAIVSALRQFQSTVKSMIDGETEDFDGEYSEKGKYAKSRIWTTVQLLNPVDSSSYSVSHILPLEVRIRLGIQ